MEAFERVVVVVAEAAAPMGGSGSSSATAVKSSQPLHNFSLPFLKWGNQTNKNKNTNNSNNNNNNNNNNNSSSSSSRCRKLVDSSSRDFSPSRDRRSSPSEPDSADEEGGGGGGGGYRRGGGRNGSGNGGDGSSRRFLFANCAAGAGTSAAAMESNGGTEGEELVELVQKPWNLRPRRSAGKAAAAAAASEIAAACKNGELGEKIENLPKSGRLRSMAEGHQSVEKEKKKRRLVISLSRDEVDEDFFIMTGSKASRRPKKRPKNIQKLVDSGLPGLWLVGLTADSYTIPDVPAKK